MPNVESGGIMSLDELLAEEDRLLAAEPNLYTFFANLHKAIEVLPKLPFNSEIQIHPLLMLLMIKLPDIRITERNIYPDLWLAVTFHPMNGKVMGAFITYRDLHVSISRTMHPHMPAGYYRQMCLSPRWGEVLQEFRKDENYFVLVMEAISAASQYNVNDKYRTLYTAADLPSHVVDNEDDDEDDEDIFTCESCGCTIYDEEDTFHHGGTGALLCDECSEYCYSCDETVYANEVSLVGENYVCNSCLGDYYSRCESCNEWYDNENIREGADERYYCDNCIEEDNCGPRCQLCGDFVEYGDDCYVGDDMTVYTCADCDAELENKHTQECLACHQQVPASTVRFDPSGSAFCTSCSERGHGQRCNICGDFIDRVYAYVVNDDGTMSHTLCNIANRRWPTPTVVSYTSGTTSYTASNRRTNNE